MDRRAKAELLKGRECRRSRAPLEVRADDGTLTLVGYASVTEKPYDMGFYQETVGAGAFKKTLSEEPDVQLLINHEGLPMARTVGGSLRLAEDEKGLRFEADLDPEDPDVARLVPKIRSNLVDECSFAFRAIRQTWDEDYTERRLEEVSIDRGDVSVVSYGANPATSVSLRAYADSLLELRAGKQLSATTMATLQEVLDLVSGADDNVDDAQVILSELMGVPNPDDPEPDAEDKQENSQSLDWLRARAIIARHRAVA